MNEHDFEPVPGLPAPLPAGETILWQGAPDWRALARRALHTRAVAIYFGVLLLWGVVSRTQDGAPAGDIALAMLWLCAMGAAAVAVLTAFAWLAARTTLYTITTRRVVMRIGIALPIALQIPFARIQAAALSAAADGTGNLALALEPGQRIAYLVLWPHARPWRITRPEPALRAIPDAARVAQILGRALAAASEHAVPAIPAQIRVDPARDKRAAVAA